MPGFVTLNFHSQFHWLFSTHCLYWFRKVRGQQTNKAEKEQLEGQECGGGEKEGKGKEEARFQIDLRLVGWASDSCLIGQLGVGLLSLIGRLRFGQLSLIGQLTFYIAL